MSDDLDRLKAALARAEPAPDAGRRAEAMARAMAEFDRVQGTAEQLRPISGRPERAAFRTGVRAMLSTLTSRAALAGTASLAAVAFGLLVVVPNAPPLPGGVTVAVPEADAPAITEREAAPKVEPATGATEAAPPRPADLAIDQAGGEGDGIAQTASEPEPAADEEAAAPAGTVTEGLTRRAAGAMPDAIPAPPLAAAPLTSAAPAAEMFALEEPPAAVPLPDTEAFPEADRNPLKVTAETPVSTFSIDVDTASYAVVRSSLNAGQLPPPDAVRIEEMVNYFPYDWPAPEAGGAPFRPTVSVMPTPWNEGTRLVTIALQGRMPAVAERPPLNLVFLVDTSGSMEDANKLPLLKQSLRLMLPQLGPEDQVAIVSYAGAAGVVLAPTPASDREAISGALDRLSAGGSTAGQEGLALAYTLARTMAAEGEVSRVLLATDGDFNVGISDPAALEDYVARERRSGTYLSVLGFGRGNLDDATMQALAQNGNGTAAYIDTLNEARKVLVDQLSGALFPIADDVKVQVEWNPAAVAEYRLIGYETRALAREDFANDRVDAGEIGAGHAVTAIYEITPVGSPARLTEPLRYGEAAAEGPAGELGFLRLRYKEPGGTASRLIENPIAADAAAGGSEARFAAAIAGFGQLLTGSTYLGDWGWDEAIALAASARGEDPFGYRAEAVNLMRLAQSLDR